MTNARAWAAGWPLPCLWSSATSNDVLAGIDVGRTDGRVLPTRPLWAGLIVNTLVYALLVSVIVLAIPIRRRLRTRRGRCPRCAYELAGDLAACCPECGWRRRAPTLSS
jgi:hypothetical protein